MAKIDRVVLRDISASNRTEVVNLQLEEWQKGYVPSVSSSLEAAVKYGQTRPCAICRESGKVVGFAQYGIDQSTGNWKIFRLLIDREVQNQGHGTLATRAIVEALREDHDADQILIVYQRENSVARHIYRKLGFKEYGADGDKILARLDFEAEQTGAGNTG